MINVHEIHIFCGFVLLLSFFANIYPADRGVRLVIVAAVKSRQFKQLYVYLHKHANNFDPRYAGSLSTNGNPHDQHKNLHITLASTDLGAKNEAACKKALSAISGYLNNKISLHFNTKALRFDGEKRVIISLVKDGGYDRLVALQKKIVKVLKKEGATGVHEKNPDHVTIGFASSLTSKSFPHAIQPGLVTHARVYLWKGDGAQAYPPREEFYPKKEVCIYKDVDNRSKNLKATKNMGKGHQTSKQHNKRQSDKQVQGKKNKTDKKKQVRKTTK